MVYTAESDPLCYPGTSVLKNLLDIRDAKLLEEAELALFLTRSEEPFPVEGRLLHLEGKYRRDWRMMNATENHIGKALRQMRGTSIFCGQASMRETSVNGDKHQNRREKTSYTREFCRSFATYSLCFEDFPRPCAARSKRRIRRRALRSGEMT